VVPLGTASVHNPALAVVYTYPKDLQPRVELAIELRIGPETCGQTLPAQTVFSRFGRVQVADRKIAVPLCGTSGDILVLKNLAPDLTLAIPK
jgi:hypothetical protein